MCNVAWIAKDAEDVQVSSGICPAEKLGVFEHSCSSAAARTRDLAGVMPKAHAFCTLPELVHVLPRSIDGPGTCLVEELGVLEILAALLQLGQGLQQLHWRGNLGQVALAHKVLHQAPHIDVLRRGLLRLRQGRAPLPPRLTLRGMSAASCPVCLQLWPNPHRTSCRGQITLAHKLHDYAPHIMCYGGGGITCLCPFCRKELKTSAQRCVWQRRGCIRSMR